MIGRSINRKRILTILQVVLGFGALVWVITQPDWAAIQSGIVMLPATTVAAVLTLSILAIVAKFTMWTALLNENSFSGLIAAGRTELAVNFVNQLLPSRLSGRVAAPLIVRRNTGIDWNSAVAITIVHTGLFALLYGVASLVGLLAGATRFPYGIAVVIFLSTGLYFIAAITILGTAIKLDRLGEWLGGVGKIPGVRRARTMITDRLLDFPLKITEVEPEVRSLLWDPRVLFSYGLSWTVALVVVPGLRLWLLFEGMGASFSPIWMLPLFAVAAYSVTLLPLTPGGIGVTEATATIVFVALGVPRAVVVPAVLIDRFVGVYLPALCGWYPTMSIGIDNLRRGKD